MKILLLLTTCLTLCPTAFARTTTPQKRAVASNASKEQGCAKTARRALLQTSQQSAEITDTDASYEFFNGAMVGDVAISVEIDVYKNKSTGAFYKVEMDGEMCTLRSIERLQSSTSGISKTRHPSNAENPHRLNLEGWRFRQAVVVLRARIRSDSCVSNPYETNKRTLHAKA